MRKYVILALLVCLVAPIAPSVSSAQAPHGCRSFLAANTGEFTGFSPGGIDQFAEMACDENDGFLCVRDADLFLFIHSGCVGGLMKTKAEAYYSYTHALDGLVSITFINIMYGVFYYQASAYHSCAGLFYSDWIDEPCPPGSNP